MKNQLLLNLLFGLATLPAEAAPEGAKIEQITGLKGTLNEAEGVFKVTKARDDVKEFLTRNKLGNAARTIDQAIERMNNCITLRAKQAPILSQWLDQQK